jgi:hypothetical protein
LPVWPPFVGCVDIPLVNAPLRQSYKARKAQ